MDLCEGCGTDPALLALRSSKVSIIGSNGSWTRFRSRLRRRSC
jgi:hypothetical protein